MQIDSHVHLLTSKNARPNWDEIQFTFQVALHDKLDVLCITEHRDSDGYEELINGLFIHPRFDGEILEPGIFRLSNGLTISCGAEVALDYGGDVGIHAPPETLINLSERKGEYSGKTLLDYMDTQNINYVSVAHHLFVPGKFPNDFATWVSRIDAIELPGKQSDKEEEYRILAQKYLKPNLGGGDSHTWLQLGACRTILKDGLGNVFSVPRLKKALDARHIEVKPIQNAKRFIDFSRLYRQRLESKLSISLFQPVATF